MLFDTAGCARRIRGVAFQFSFIRFSPRAVALIVVPGRRVASFQREITQKDYKHRENVFARCKLIPRTLNRAHSLS